MEESPEYADYADLDELEEISASEASNKSSNEGQCYSAPLYKVLEGPSYDYASAPMYDVLEGPDPESYGTTNLGFEPPVYAVLEGPDSNWNGIETLKKPLDFLSRTGSFSNASEWPQTDIKMYKIWIMCYQSQTSFQVTN